MKLVKETLKAIEATIKKTNRIFAGVACAILAIPVFLTVADVTGRYLGKPILGTLEVCELCMVVVVTLGLAHTQALGGHISINLVSRVLPAQIQGILKLSASFLGLVIFGFLAWGAIPFTLDSVRGGGATTTLGIPIAPFRALIFVGAVGLMCQFVFEIVDHLLAKLKRRT
jgi:TRAP-type C4-dicarboxylate transport system permease small subunit